MAGAGAVLDASEGVRTDGPARTGEALRDRWGIPHLRASDELALAELQGRITARDRAWQIETDRWRAEGRLAERIGEPGVEWDLFARRIRIADTASRAYEALDAGDRAWVDAYVRGVNTELPTARRAAPEFAQTGAAADDPWPAWAPLGIFHVAHVLFSAFPHTLWRAHVEAALGPDAVDLFDTDGGPGSGSNAWALDGSRVEGGLPLLAGDPHRLLELPGVYQQVHLACPEYDVVGLAFPGVPGVQHYGHTGGAAWGVTNAMAHDVDVFRERLLRTASGVDALGPAGWEAAAVHTEVIAVRGGAPVEVEVVETARGPVVAGPFVGGAFAGVARPFAGGAGPFVARPGGAGSDEPAAQTGISVHQPARADADLGFAALRPLLRATSSADVAAAFASWVTPVDRVIAADSAGGVLRFTAGRVPGRARHERRVPLDAWLSTHPVTPAQLSQARPVAGLHVDANERPADGTDDLGYAYAPGDRARRIRVLIDQPATSASAEAHDRVFADTHSEAASTLIAFAAGVPHLSPAARALLDRMLAWNRHFDADSRPAAEFARWRSALVTRLAAHPALRPLHAATGHPAIFAPWLSVTARVADALPALLGAPTPGVAGQATPHTAAARRTAVTGLTAAALGIDGPAEAAAALETVSAGAVSTGTVSAGAVSAGATGDDGTVAAGWSTETWGDRHRMHPLPVIEPGPETDQNARFDVPLGGDTDCVLATSSAPGFTDRSARASVARWVWHLGDRRRSRWIVPFGASGDPTSPHFADQLPLWRDVRTIAVETDWATFTHEEYL